MTQATYASAQTLYMPTTASTQRSHPACVRTVKIQIVKFASNCALLIYFLPRTLFRKYGQFVLVVSNKRMVCDLVFYLFIQHCTAFSDRFSHFVCSQRNQNFIVWRTQPDNLHFIALWCENDTRNAFHRFSIATVVLHHHNDSFDLQFLRRIRGASCSLCAAGPSQVFGPPDDGISVDIFLIHFTMHHLRAEHDCAAICSRYERTWLRALINYGNRYEIRQFSGRSHWVRGHWYRILSHHR